MENNISKKSILLKNIKENTKCFFREAEFGENIWKERTATK